MTPLLQQQDQIANNLANIHTTGFKQSGLFVKSYHRYLANDLQEPFADNDMRVDEVYIDYREGPMTMTKAPLDCYIKGTGFFTIMTSDGIAYTRNGNFALDPDGIIVTSDGEKVMGVDGFIRVERELPVTITEEGEVLQEEKVKGVLKVVDFEKPYRLRRCGEGRFLPLLPENPERQSAGFSIRQGYLEGSNVDMIRNMVRMIALYRNFEADQKALHAQDETLEKAVNQVGRIG
ncbi:MAG: flagellar hook-basal body protein [Chitinispirillaceae bacterium]|nr:flagellar hook-basal body protein [Chitinispirillaceae bacterium]